MCSPPTFCFVQTLKSAHHHSTNKSITTPSFDEITYLLQGNILNEYRIYVRLLHFKLHKSVLFTYKRCRVKCTLVQALRLCTGRTAHRGSRGIALPFLDHGTRRGWGVRVTPWSFFTPGKDPVPIVQKAGWAPGFRTRGMVLLFTVTAETSK